MPRSNGNVTALERLKMWAALDHVQAWALDEVNGFLRLWLVLEILSEGDRGLL